MRWAGHNCRKSYAPLLRDRLLHTTTRAQPMNKQFTSHLTVSLDIRNVLEESNDNGENQHEAHGEDQWPCEHDAAATQHLLHVEVEAQLHHDGPVHTTQLKSCADSVAPPMGLGPFKQRWRVKSCSVELLCRQPFVGFTAWHKAETKM